VPALQDKLEELERLTLLLKKLRIAREIDRAEMRVKGGDPPHHLLPSIASILFTQKEEQINHMFNKSKGQLTTSNAQQGNGLQAGSPPEIGGGGVI
jgi:hypothetical protein